MEEETRGSVTAKSPSDLGLEMHLVVGLLDDVLLKHFSSFVIMKNKTTEPVIFFNTMSVVFTAGLI